MPRGKSSNTLSDKYLQQFQFDESSASSTALQSWEYDTGMSARGGWIWEVYFVETFMEFNGSVIASGATGAQHIALSMMAGLAALPEIGAYGTLYRRTQYRIGNGTSNLCVWSWPSEIVMNFNKPILYAKPKIYLYYVGSVAGVQVINGRIGYLTKAVSGSLLWETVEQYMSGV